MVLSLSGFKVQTARAGMTAPFAAARALLAMPRTIEPPIEITAVRPIPDRNIDTFQLWPRLVKSEVAP
ncbi:hypothetical protein [Nannocystis radixulma]|uniref:Uncharacterized protein n=1 Tax=Nannocystis radixulma TaxID=2995305 RepID=A0ABT5B8I9_9BACT|nr:hypothetical protein [Nannocystis radixulma]MDC0669773.1 hypothetical protein [Nannocystis radixulma]